ncbi:CrcB family protein [Tetragenococcus muriaticus]|uniref:fluoride efflux transporter FluC n=1 Tax=Tetragenococcus muriaticus TaxID=64642 RepID=UPI0018CF61E6
MSFRQIGSKKGWRHAFPLATFIINSVGCFFLGLVTGLSLETGFSLLIGTGFMGSFTTFSTFNIESIELLRMKNFKHFFFYTGASYTFGILASFVGIICGNLI